MESQTILCQERFDYGIIGRHLLESSSDNAIKSPDAPITDEFIECGKNETKIRPFWRAPWSRREK
jgi:hypothetical protein